MPDEAARRRADDERRRQREASRRGRRINDRGRQFHLGMAQQRGETRENGWRYEHVTRTDHGNRRHDTARVIDPNDRRFTEYKSGRTLTERTMPQLDKDTNLLSKGWRGEWVIPADAHLSRSVDQRLRDLQRQYPGRFTVTRVSRDDINRAIALGKELERHRNQPELFDTARMRARELARQRAERVKDIARTKDAAHRAIKAREARQKAERARQQTRAREPAQRAERDRVERTAADQVAKEFAAKYPDLFQHTTTGHTTDDTDRARERARQAAELQRQRREVMERADRERLAQQQYWRSRGAPELADNLEFTRGMPPPGVRLPGFENNAPTVQRGRDDDLERQRQRHRQRHGREPT